MEVSISSYRDHTMVTISGEVDLYNVGDLKKRLFSATDGAAESIIVDMKDVSYMDSSGIGALVAGQKKMRVRNGKFAIMNVHSDVMNILKLATLDKFFTIYENEEDFI